MSQGHDKYERANRNLLWFAGVLYGGIVVTYGIYGLMTVGSATMLNRLLIIWQVVVLCLIVYFLYDLAKGHR